MRNWKTVISAGALLSGCALSAADMRDGVPPTIEAEVSAPREQAIRCVAQRIERGAPPNFGQIEADLSGIRQRMGDRTVMTVDFADDASTIGVQLYANPVIWPHMRQSVVGALGSCGAKIGVERSPRYPAARLRDQRPTGD